jgi:putative membrane protein
MRNEEFTMMYWGDHMGGWGYFLMALNMVVFWGVVIGGIVLLVRYLGGERTRPASPAGGSDPQRLLAERYARGEIDDEEYQRRLDALRGSGPLSPR